MIKFQSFLHIIAKLACNIFSALVIMVLVFPSTASASSEFRVVNPSIAVTVGTDHTADISITLQITNTSDQLLDLYEIEVPFTSIEGAEMRMDGKKKKTGVITQGENSIIRAEFSSTPLRSNATTTIKFSFTASNIWESYYGIRYLEFPNMSVAGNIPISYRINYPTTFPDTSFVSEINYSDSSHSISLNSNDGFYISWGNSSRFSITDKPSISEESKFPALIPIPVSNTTQQVTYLSFPQNRVGFDPYNNYWGIVQQSEGFEYQANVDITPQADPASAIGAIDFGFPYDGQLIGTDISDQELLENTFNYLADHFTANAAAVNRVDEYHNLNEMWRELNSLSKFEFALSTVSILRANGMYPSIKYGYLIAPNMRGFNTNQPHIWAEVVIDGKNTIIDPYLSLATGYDFVGIENFNRLEYGTYVPGNQQDLLGITSGSSQRPRGDLSDVTEFPTPVELGMYINSPEEVSSGLFYNVGVRVTNAGGTPVNIDSIILDGEDIGNSYLSINENLQEAVPPYGEVNFNLVYLREPNLLSDELEIFNISIQPEGLTQLNDTYVIQFNPNPLLLAGMLVLVIAAISLILGVLVYLLTGRWIFEVSKNAIHSIQSVRVSRRKVLRVD